MKLHSTIKSLLVPLILAGSIGFGFADEQTDRPAMHEKHTSYKSEVEIKELTVKGATAALDNGDWVFFDLADPAKRTKEDLEEVLAVISQFQDYFKVILGLNFAESRQVGDVLGIPSEGDAPEQVAAHAAKLVQALKIETVVIHPTQFAAAADSNGSAFVMGPYTEHPKITTGAGDHFNAGFCMGRLIGADLEKCLQFGVATSGFYVRNALSPRIEDLEAFLQTI